VPLELIGGDPRVLRPPEAPPERPPTPLTPAPPVVPDPVDSWAERDSLFGDL
jgi:hypothetical protein